MSSLAETYLSCVEHDARSLAHYSYQLERHVTFITTIPAFRTAAEGALDDAEAKLKSALDAVRKAKRDMRPVALKVAS